MPLPISTKRASLLFLLALTVAVLTVLFILTQPFVTPQPSAKRQADPARLEAHVRYLSQTVYPRSFEQAENLNAAADYIKQVLQESGAEVFEQEYYVEQKRYRNIVARFGSKIGETVVVGAHYDSHADVDLTVQYEKGYGAESHTPGADDNASGIAGILELARLLKDAPLNVGVELVAYTLEEPPFFRTESMGSAVHAASFSQSKRSVSLMIALEMIGYFNSESDSQSYPFSVLGYIYPRQGDFIAVVGRVSDMGSVRRVKSALLSVSELPVYSLNAPERVTGVDFSDHFNYWKRDIPAVMITDTAFYRNYQYHQAGDSADRLNYLRMAQVVDGVFALLSKTSLSEKL